MTTKDEALKQALDALEYSKSYLDELADLHGTSKRAKPGSTSWNVNRAITACREALAQKGHSGVVTECVERGDATNLARRLIEDDTYAQITEKGVMCLCEAVMRMDAALAQKDELPEGYTQRVIDALYENGDPVSVDAAEEMARLFELLRQKDDQEPVAWAVMQNGEICWDADYPFSNEPGWSDSDQECVPLYTHPQPRQPLTDAQRYALIEKHLGLEQRKNATVIDHRTGRWTDAARYFDLMDAAIETANGTGEQT